MDEEIDEYCKKIFIVLVMIDRRIRLNELDRALKKYGVKMTKVTLIEHLHHLTDQKTIRRTQEDRQKVYYNINWERLTQLRRAKGISQAARQYMNEQKIFKSKSPRGQIAFVTDMLVIAALLKIKLGMLNILEPQNTLQQRIMAAYIETYNTLFVRSFIQSCKRSKEDCQKILQTIDRTIDELAEPFAKVKSDNAM